MLSKQVFVLLLPLSLFALYTEHRDIFFRLHKPPWLFGTLALFACGLTCAVVNWIKLANPLASGYSQSPEFVLPWADASVLSNIYIYFFDMQRSLFIFFPLLLIACFGVFPFCRSHRSLYTVIIGHFLVFLILTSALTHVWHGEWAYGPRLLLFVLPALSLPALTAIERALKLERARRNVLMVTVAILLLASFDAQTKVVAMPFNYTYKVLDQLRHYDHPAYRYRLRQFLYRAHPATLYEALSDVAHDEPNKIFELVRFHSPKKYEQLRSQLQTSLPINIWWVKNRGDEKR